MLRNEALYTIGVRSGAQYVFFCLPSFARFLLLNGGGCSVEDEDAPIFLYIFAPNSDISLGNADSAD